MSELVNDKGIPFKLPDLAGLTIAVPGAGTDEEWKNRLAAWADLLGEIPGMNRRRIYEVFGKAKPYKGPRGKNFHGISPAGVLPHKSIRVLRRRALAEHLRRIPHRPFRYAGVEARRPSAVRYMDGL